MYDDQLLTNLRPDDTRLAFVVYVSPKGGARHGPRIKVSRKYGEETFPGKLPTQRFEIYRWPPELHIAAKKLLVCMHVLQPAHGMTCSVNVY